MNAMECDELVEQITNYLEDALSSRDKARLETHRSMCIGCQAYLSEFDVTLGLLSDMPPEPISADLESNLLMIYRDWSESTRR